MYVRMLVPSVYYVADSHSLVDRFRSPSRALNDVFTAVIKSIAVWGSGPLDNISAETWRLIILIAALLFVVQFGSSLVPFTDAQRFRSRSNDFTRWSHTSMSPEKIMVGIFVCVIVLVVLVVKM